MANIVPTAGLDRIAALMGADTVHLAVGTGTTTPAAGNTDLVTETARRAVDTTIQTGNQIEFRGFFANSILPTTVNEVGLFFNGSGSLNSGELMVRANAIAFTKGTTDLYLTFKVTIAES
jgi:hypothetical protein